MFASASHEFRTPLNAIINSFEFLNYSFKFLMDNVEVVDKDNPAQMSKFNHQKLNFEKFSKIGHNSSILLLSLVEDILNLSKMEAGTFNIVKTDFKLDVLIDEVYNIFDIQCQQKGIRLIVDVDDKLQNVEINSDHQRIKQVLLNLLSNAVKFTFNGSITVTVKLVSKLGVHCIMFEVLDTGIGIKDEQQNTLFTLFGTISESQPMNQNGTGLGLTISKKYVEALGGSIALESKYGVGTKINFIVPMNEGVIDNINQYIGNYLHEISGDNMNVSQECESAEFSHVNSAKELYYFATKELFKTHL